MFINYAFWFYLLEYEKLVLDKINYNMNNLFMYRNGIQTYR